MPYQIPTLTTLQEQGRQDVSISPLGIDGVLRWSIAGVLADVQAGYAYQHYDYQAWIAQQATPWTATAEFADGWGALKGVPRKPAVAAVLTATAAAGSGNTPGASIPAGTACTVGTTAYLTTADATVASNGSASITIQATVADAAGNAAVGAKLVLSNSLTGVKASSFAVAGQVATGVDMEDDSTYRTRYLAAYRSPPQGGALADYVEWAEAVPGVTRAWVNPNGMGAGTVVVYTMWDLAQASSGGFPQGTNGVATSEARDPNHLAAGSQLQVANALFPLRPVTALVYSCSPIDLAVPFNIAGLGSANTAANRAAIKAALADMFLRLGAVGGTLDPDTMAPWPPIDPSSWYAAIASALGSNQFTVLSPVAPIQPGTGYLPTLDAAGTSFAG